jgi:hypothetical protein
LRRGGARPGPPEDPSCHSRQPKLGCISFGAQLELQARVDPSSWAGGILRAEAGRQAEHRLNDWVGDWGVCRAWGALAKVRGGETCQRCRSETKVLAKGAQYRPVAIAVFRESEVEGTGLATMEEALISPDDTTDSAWEVALEVADIAGERLANGDTLEFALGRIAAGRDLITHRLAKRGINLDRKTVARALEELHQLGVIRRHDRLLDWDDIVTRDGRRR